MFQLSIEEITQLSRTQFATLNKTRGYNIKYAPFVFTELGVAMLSSVLNSKTAIEINRSIMRAFVVIRHAIATKPTNTVAELQTELKELKAYIEDVFTDYNDINEDTRVQIELINQSLAELHTDKKRIDKPRNRIGFITE
jgi:peptidoglycan hydrolase CwlO-like protein